MLVVPALELGITGTSELDRRNSGNEAQFTGIVAIVDRSVVPAAQ